VFVTGNHFFRATNVTRPTFAYKSECEGNTQTYCTVVFITALKFFIVQPAKDLDKEPFTRPITQCVLAVCKKVQKRILLLDV